MDITVVHNGCDLSFSLKEIKSHLTNVLCIEIHRFFKDGQLSCSWACSRDKLMPFYHLWLCVYIIYLFLYVSLHLSIHQLSIDLSIIYGGRRGSCCSVAKWCLTLCPPGLQHSRLLCPPLSAGGRERERYIFRSRNKPHKWNLAFCYLNFSLIQLEIIL